MDFASGGLSSMSDDRYEIHSDVPIPDARSFAGAVKRRWPFERLQVGQCFFVDSVKDTAEGATAENSVRTSSSRFSHNGKKFSVRRIDSSRLGVWRTK